MSEISTIAARRSQWWGIVNSMDYTELIEAFDLNVPPWESRPIGELRSWIVDAHEHDNPNQWLAQRAAEVEAAKEQVVHDMIEAVYALSNAEQVVYQKTLEGALSTAERAERLWEKK